MSTQLPELSLDELELIVGGKFDMGDAMKLASSIVKLLAAVATIATMVLAIV